MAFIEKKRILFLGLPWTFTKYKIDEAIITIDQGLLHTEENDCYMYKIQDVKLNTSLLERICGLGTITCYTGDVTNPKLELIHIKNSKLIKDYILETSEMERRKRRTLNTQNIGVDDIDDTDAAF